MGLVGRVPKNGRNDFHKYDYATEADILDAVREAMAARRLVMVPSAQDAKSEPIGDKGDRLFTLLSRFTVHDGDSGEELAFNMYGQGADKLDKGCYKAATGAEKYAVLKLFMISTGDDAEKDEKHSSIPPPAGLAGVKAKMSSTDERRRTHPEIIMGNFGSKKGAKLSDLTDNDVSFYRLACKRTIADPSKERFHASETLRLASFDAELRFRGLPVE